MATLPAMSTSPAATVSPSITLAWPPPASTWVISPAVLATTSQQPDSSTPAAAGLGTRTLTSNRVPWRLIPIQARSSRASWASWATCCRSMPGPYTPGYTPSCRSWLKLTAVGRRSFPLTWMVSTKRDKNATAPRARGQAGAAIQAPLYGNEVKEVFSALPKPFDEFVPHLLASSAFGDFATRGGLDVAQRELISLVAIAAIGATTQLRPHVAGAIRAGSSRQKVAAALVQVMLYIGGPYALSGLVLVARYDESASAEAYR